MPDHSPYARVTEKEKKKRAPQTKGASVKGYKFPQPSEEHKKLLRFRWPDGNPQCPYCGATKNQSRLSKKTRLCDLWFSCKRCWHEYTPMTGTLAHKSRVPLDTWLIAIEAVIKNPTISSIALGNIIGKSSPTALRMRNKITLAICAGGIRKGVIGGGNMPNGNLKSRTPPSMKKYFATRVRSERLRKWRKKVKERNNDRQETDQG
jgi:transposase-like protein